jgi:hypothetical protein
LIRRLPPHPEARHTPALVHPQRRHSKTAEAIVAGAKAKSHDHEVRPRYYASSVDEGDLTALLAEHA